MRDPERRMRHACGMATGAQATWGVLCALPEELGSLAPRAGHRTLHQGLEVLELELAGARVLACVSGIGKVRAAHGASVLVAAGAHRALLVVGTCGGLRQALGPGTFVHCTIAAQTDLAVRSGREIPSDPELRAAWREVAPGPEGWFLTADRPVLSLWRRLRLARAFAGPCVADMETAAAAAVAARAGIAWAALRTVTDRATLGGIASFRRHYPTCASLAADTVERLVTRLERGSVAPGRPPR
jgi:adenosylhomocysteine nucleosidase